MTNQTTNGASPLRAATEGDVDTFPIQVLHDIARLVVHKALSIKIERADIGLCLDAISYALDLRGGEDPGRAADWLRSLERRFREREWSSTQACARGLRRLGLAMIGSIDVDEKAFYTLAYPLVVAHVSRALRALALIQQDPMHYKALYEAADDCVRTPTFSTFSKAEKIARSVTSPDYSLAANAARASYESAHYAAAASNPGVFYLDSVAHAAEAIMLAAQAEATAIAAAPDSGLDADTFTLDATLSACAEEFVGILSELKAPGCQWLDLAQAT